MKVKELKEILEECDDELDVEVEYEGSNIDLEQGDIFRTINGEEISLYCVYIKFK